MAPPAPDELLISQSEELTASTKGLLREIRQSEIEIQELIDHARRLLEDSYHQLRTFEQDHAAESESTSREH